MTAIMQPRRPLTVKAHSGPFFGPEEEFDCPDEEECEIDWDLMPGFGDDDENEVEENPGSLSFGSLALESLERERVRFEMGWEIDECRGDEDLCEDFCSDCAGNGKVACRFCHGTNYIVLGDDFIPCIICSEGREDCAPCRGTGQIAPWATTMGQYLNVSNTL
jgi:hypothetical protein